VKDTTHIFIVGNNNLSVSLLGYVFTKDATCAFSDFETGEDCLNHLHLGPSIIVLDYALPRMNGYDTLLEIREQLPQAYVLALLSEHDARKPYELIAAGADTYLKKEETGFLQKVIEKIENFLIIKKETARKRRSPVSRIYYYILILLLISAGIYYSQ
jgi:DNA-binding NarL/FixJ family response regulator